MFTSNSARPRITVVAPACNEAQNVEECCRRLTTVLSGLGRFEIIFVDDGSSDGTGEILRRLHEKDGRVKVVFLSRNFGQQAAVSAGLEYATGDAVIIMDADLQHPPELLPTFVGEWQRGFEVVLGIRKNRKGNPLLRLVSWSYYRIWNAVSEVSIPLDAGEFCLLDRKVVEAIRRCEERNRFIRAVRSWVGFKQIGIEYEGPKRMQGRSTYNFFKRLRGALDGIFSTSDFPLHLATYAGILLTLAGVSTAACLLYRWLVINVRPEGWASLLCVVLVVGGVQFILMGTIGAYLGRVYREVRGRPSHIVREELGFSPPGDPTRH